jgi:hypothetical protein
MAKESNDMIRLQLAMAFGQGAGFMLANPEAVTYAVSSQAALIERAAGDWEASKYPFIELVRVLGQMAATRAAVDGKPEISKKHVEDVIGAVLGICPCFAHRK